MGGASVAEAMQQIDKQLGVAIHTPNLYTLLHETSELHASDIVPTGACLTLVLNIASWETAMALEEQQQRLIADLTKNEALQRQQTKEAKLRKKSELEAWHRKETAKQLEKDMLAKEESRKARESTAQKSKHDSKASPAGP